MRSPTLPLVTSTRLFSLLFLRIGLASGQTVKAKCLSWIRSPETATPVLTTLDSKYRRDRHPLLLFLVLQHELHFLQVS
ncbi:hypothetical protein BT63DRAFT_419990 [Microthyrium microscopicum]|uniref:Secreted protein n=1 Tax=Microthyrium microscopicum TaxID=703497 RepID=A0A6A6USG6_9PEZI|nr:hypothetical protein BT63DRAFT_419990 [Microthyrium microscopicum]